MPVFFSGGAFFAQCCAAALCWSCCFCSVFQVVGSMYPAVPACHVCTVQLAEVQHTACSNVFPLLFTLVPVHLWFVVFAGRFGVLLI